MGTSSPAPGSDRTACGSRAPSQAYGTLGKGMHAGLSGHSFVLVDAHGVQRWYGEYPSMWLDPAELLRQLRERLPAA
jgi:hypothetical protein